MIFLKQHYKSLQDPFFRKYQQERQNELQFSVIVKVKSKNKHIVKHFLQFLVLTDPEYSFSLDLSSNALSFRSDKNQLLVNGSSAQ